MRLLNYSEFKKTNPKVSTCCGITLSYQLLDRYDSGLIKLSIFKPCFLKPAINEKVKQVSGGRSFVRPSGTEDAVRVYAEAETREACDDLAIQIAKLVHQLGGGEGEFPEKLF